MTVEEFDSALTELETRVDRLRALYENWFRGYEKAEPRVPRKDVERRVYGLRKDLPRNTALRFRYHQLYLKYTTMANYWQRTSRQIEDGTYKPQLLRLKRKLQLEQEQKERREKGRKEREEREPGEGPRGYELDLDESLNVEDLLDELELSDVAKALDEPGPHSEPPPPPTKQHPRPAPAPSAAQVSGTFPHPKKQAGEAPKAPLPGLVMPSLAAREGLPKPAPLAPALPPPFAKAVPTSATGQPPARPAPAPGPSPAGAARPVGPPLPPAPAKSAPGVPNIPAARPPAPLPASVHNAAAAGKPALPAAPAPARPTASTLGRPAPAPTPPQRPVPASGTIVGRPPLASPLASPSAAPNEQRLKHIYDEYLAARRRNNEGEVRYEAMVSSIQKMLPELAKKHQGKRIDFDVVVKDGRVGLKPKAT